MVEPQGLALHWGGWTRWAVGLIFAAQLAEAIFDAARGEFLSTGLPRLVLLALVACLVWKRGRRPVVEISRGSAAGDPPARAPRRRGS